MEKLVIDIVKSKNYKNKNLKKKAQIITSSLYEKDTRFFFDIAKTDLNNNVSTIKYIGRYLSRAPIAEYKILVFSDNKVTFYYKALSNNKKKVEVTMDVEKFLSKLIIHIPPKNFKTIRRFGIYSRNIKIELKFIISRMKKYKSQYTKTIFYHLKIWKTFGINLFTV